MCLLVEGGERCVGGRGRSREEGCAEERERKGLVGTR